VACFALCNGAELRRSGHRRLACSNVGTRDLYLPLGCGAKPPIKLDTPDGELGIGSESADFCGWLCDDTYAGNPSQGCSDCGPGYADALAPGATVIVEWNRRVFIHHTAPKACAGVEGTVRALGLLAEPGVVTSGTLNVCFDEFGNLAGDCTGVEEPFTIDLTAPGLAIDVE